MKSSDKIKKALSTIMPEGDANACEVWKGWGWGQDSFCWWYKPFGRAAQALGGTVDEALDTINDWYTEQLQDKYDNAPLLDEELFDLFVAHGTAAREIAAMDIDTVTHHVSEMRRDELDDMPLTNTEIAEAILAFASSGT